MKNLTSILALSLILANTGAFAAETSGEGGSISILSGKAQFNALGQFWVVNDTTNSKVPYNFRPRRAEMKLSGSVAESTRWAIMIDPAKSLSTSGDNKVLQDLFLGYSPVSELELVAGQFKVPNVSESLESSTELLFPERAAVTREYGERRDPGVMATYKTALWKATAAVTNGQGANQDDTNSPKDATFRMDVLPADFLRIGAFTSAQDFHYGTRGRWGGNVRLSVDSLVARAEGVVGSESGKKSYGYVVDAGYMLFDRIQPALRWDSVIKNDTYGYAALGGVNYFINKNNAKLQLAYGYLRNMAGKSGSYSYSLNSKGTLLVMAFQMAI